MAALTAESHEIVFRSSLLLWEFDTVSAGFYALRRAKKP